MIDGLNTDNGNFNNDSNEIIYDELKKKLNGDSDLDSNFKNNLILLLE